MNNLVPQNLNIVILVISFITLLTCLSLLILFLYRRKPVESSVKFDDLLLKILAEIKSSVTPKFMSVSVEANEIADLAVEIWRIEQRISKSSSSLPENQLKGLENSTLKLRRYLEKYDIEIVDYKDHKYNEGLNLDILSVEKDISLLEPIVKETVEPTIMLKGQLIRKAKIILLTNS